MTTASLPDGFNDDIINEIHLLLFREAMDILDLPSAKPADLADVIAWILRPARLYKDGRLVYDGMKVPFSWQLSCKAVGVDPDLYREKLVEEGILSQEFISLAQYLAEWKVVQKRDEKSERMLDKLLGPNCMLSTEEKYQVFEHLAALYQVDLFDDFDLPDVLPEHTVKRVRAKKAASKPIESYALF